MGILSEAEGGIADTLLGPWTHDEMVNGKAVKCEGTVRRVEGMTPMYDWEFSPQAVDFTAKHQWIEAMYAK